MAVIPAVGDPPPAQALEEAAAALAEGRPVVIPTDTVYGLAADPFLPGATGRLFEVKRRPRQVDLPVLVADLEQARSLAAAVPDQAQDLLARFWPGPLTVVLPRRPGLALDLGADEATVGLRVPDHPVPLALCRARGPLAVTSANLHGEATPETAEDVARALGPAVAVVLDGGPCRGSPSTVVDLTGPQPRLLREGRVPWAEVAAALSS